MNGKISASSSPSVRRHLRRGGLRPNRAPRRRAASAAAAPACRTAPFRWSCGTTTLRKRPHHAFGPLDVAAEPDTDCRPRGWASRCRCGEARRPRRRLQQAHRGDRLSESTHTSLLPPARQHRFAQRSGAGDPRQAAGHTSYASLVATAKAAQARRATAAACRPSRPARSNGAPAPGRRNRPAGLRIVASSPALVAGELGAEDRRGAAAAANAGLMTSSSRCVSHVRRSPGRPHHQVGTDGSCNSSPSSLPAIFGQKGQQGRALPAIRSPARWPRPPCRCAPPAPAPALRAIAAQFQRIAIFIGHAAQDDVDRQQSAERLQIDAVVAHRQIAPFDQRVAQIAGQISSSK